MESIQTLIENNVAWADSMRRSDPDFFTRLAQQQSPKFLWIGCSDSRVPANQITGLPPGEVFVHRNVANVVQETDFNVLAVLQYAVDVLKVRHVIVCGHYGCGGVRASLTDNTEGLANHWVEPIRRLARRNGATLAPLDPGGRIDRLAELNVAEGVERVAETPILRAAWRRGQPVAIHGLIYGLKDGLLRDLGCTCTGPRAGESASP